MHQARPQQPPRMIIRGTQYPGHGRVSREGLRYRICCCSQDDFELAAAPIKDPLTRRVKAKVASRANLQVAMGGGLGRPEGGVGQGRETGSAWCFLQASGPLSDLPSLLPSSLLPLHCVIIEEGTKRASPSILASLALPFRKEMIHPLGCCVPHMVIKLYLES